LPRGFSEHEREAIRAKLIEEGRRLFDRYGLSRTTVDELSAAAGIAKGSFYKFFGSKELLCMAVLEEEETRIKAAVLAAAGSRPDVHSAFRAAMESMLSFMRGDSLIIRLRDSGDYALLARTVGTDRLAEHFRADIETAAAFLELLREKGAECRVDPEVFAGLLRALVMMMLHEEEIGRQVAGRTFDLLMTYVANGVVGKADNE